MSLRWAVEPARCHSDNLDQLRIEAAPRTDLFVDPAGGALADNAPRAIGQAPNGDFQLVAYVHVGFHTAFDAGALLVWAGDRRWAKLCFERSPDGLPMVVSVVTKGISDDANAFAAGENSVWLRVSRRGSAWAFHASLEGTRWQFVRQFSLADSADAAGAMNGTGVEIGFSAQSPTGDGCVVQFTDIALLPERLHDPRDGS